MAVTLGTRIGVYEVIALIGKGGMGQVYRARDTTLNREVALKVLPDSFAYDADRVARFRREALLLAALNHPNIAHVHGLEESNGVGALVMELVEGDDLSQRVAHGPIPIAEALAYAGQIADALDAAHGKGIVHRDLKPANIKITSDGVVKVLDFGLAKTVTGGVSASESQAPTVASTVDGVVLGTAAYMSPEQARGQAVDKRTDIWAFGCVFYEMLTGTKAFGGKTISDTVARVLEREPDWSVLPASTPSAIQRLLFRCLVKDSKQRLRDIGDAKIEIVAKGDPLPTRGKQAKTRQTWYPWIATAIVALALALIVLRDAPWRTTVTPESVRLTAELGGGAWLSPVPLPFGSAFAISPDGTVLAFVGQQDDRDAPRLYVRRLNELQPTPLAGTEGPTLRAPFFSPDGRWIGFYRQGTIWKVSVNGGAATQLASTGVMPGATWSGENTILFSPDVSAGTVLWRVSSDGGKPEPLTSLVEGEQVHAWPQVLPGGKAVLYTSNHVSSAFNEAQIVVQSLQSGARRVVHNGGFHGRYLNSGHLVYIHDGTLFAAAFDLDRLELAGKPVAVLPGVASNAANGGAQFSVSDNGMLAYLPGRAEGLARSLQFMDRDGKTTPVRSAPMNWLNLVFARDGRRLAMEILGESSDIWVYELARDTMTRVTSHPAEDTRPVWTPNDRRIVFASSRAGKSVMNLYWQRSDGTGEAERLTDSPYNQRPNSFHPSGRFLAFDEASANRYDVMILPLDGDDASRWTPGTPRPLLDGPSSRLDPMFSPDGRWIAYASDQSGVIEVHVAPFPGPGRTVQMSLGGGGTPTWSRTKQELFYEADGQIKVVRYSVAGKEIRAAKPELWSESRHEGDMTSRAFDLHPDGARFVLSPTTRGPGGAKVDKVVFVSNFFDELRRVAP